MKDKWRDLETGPDSPRIVNAVEKPGGLRNKYDYDVKKRKKQGKL